MTISYNRDVSSVSSFTYLKLLLRWRGSIWKSVKTEFAIWIFGYYVVFAIYRYALNSYQQRKFEKIAFYCNEKLDYIPLTFMLAFFVNVIADRWRKIFNNMGWIENSALTLSALLKSEDNEEEARLMRRSITRYMILSQILTYRDISIQVRRRFPDLSTIVAAGFMMEHEMQMLENVSCSYNKYWVPINWALSITAKAFSKNYIESAPGLSFLIKEILDFRTNLALLCNYDWVPIPIAYPQVVFLAVRSYFIICLVSRQSLIGDGAPAKTTVDVYVPFMTMLQFLFFVAWMKVAEALLNPLGEDDDDFECNFLIDRNISIGMAIVDQTCGKYPTLVMDNLSERDFSRYNGTTGEHALVGSAASVLFPPSSTDAFSREGSFLSFSKTSVGRRSQLSTSDKKSSKLSQPSTPMQSRVTPNNTSVDQTASTNCELQRGLSSTRRKPNTAAVYPISEESKCTQDSKDAFTVIKF
ncbi:hypothetical protein KIN20_022186 [Parelaphostrongylus tenuis]|uniref:Bestrophin homolog n=1 Tax=Parelaphostrongylus tenuis TaxID=148309 RepID=A0AAD5MPY3_PARTN|nr:hypothetical protein KIN20_022186 [Parelaphostrongylus tenuis]